MALGGAAAVLVLLCAAAAGSAGRPKNGLMVNPCRDQGSAFAKMLFCNGTAPLEARIDDIIGRLSLPEKIGALGTSTPALPSIGMPAGPLTPNSGVNHDGQSYNWWTEATSGISWAHCGSCKTSKFAFPITLGMSFNRSLWRATGNQIAREARALMNEGTGYSTFWAPVVNVRARHVSGWEAGCHPQKRDHRG